MFTCLSVADPIASHLIQLHYNSGRIFGARGRSFDLRGFFILFSQARGPFHGGLMTFAQNFSGFPGFFFAARCAELLNS